jgi:hypothetical protein
MWCELLSSLAFKFNLRRYSLASAPLQSHSEFFGKER